MNTLANTYYLKALDNYPYDLPEFLESINYTLSYDENHADAHCLMGMFCMEQMNKFSDAKYHFEMALVNDIENINTYYQFIRLCILTDDLNTAEQLIISAQKIKGISQAALLHRLAIINEKKENYKVAKDLLNKAIILTVFSNDIDFYKNEKLRIKNKRPKKGKNKVKNKLWKA